MACCIGHATSPLGPYGPLLPWASYSARLGSAIGPHSAPRNPIDLGVPIRLTLVIDASDRDRGSISPTSLALFVARPPAQKSG
jgi:hypothetical protein